LSQRKTQLLIVLNDNEMSISPTVGAFSHYLSQIKLSSAWQQSKTAYDALVERIPFIGPTVLELSQRFRKSVVNFAQPGQLFEDLGITYIGPVRGHDLKALESTISRALLTMDGPVIVHVRTRKGRGYRPAETDAIGFHGAALPPMTVVPPTAAASAAILAPCASKSTSATELPSPAPRWIRTSWPRSPSSRTPAGVIATRYSSALVSVGTPTLIRMRSR